MPHWSRAHYDRLASGYNDHWVYSEPFMAWMTKSIVSRLPLAVQGTEAPQVVADIGCGTGLFASRLTAHGPVVLCVDASAKMLANLPDQPRLIPVLASAEEVASGTVALPYQAFDAILIKDVIHHIPLATRDAVIAGLARMLAPGGRLLVVTLPRRLDYPLFPAALDAFERHQPHPDEIADQLREAGLSVDITYDGFPLSFSRERYLRMVRDRYLSVLSLFDDTTLEAGMADIAARPEETFEFVDRFAFVVGIATD